MTRVKKKLADLIDGLDILSMLGDPEVEISSVELDSRRVSAGSLFVALPGQRVDGHEFIGQATKKGAVAVLVSAEVEGPLPDVVIRVADTYQALGEVAARFYSHPSRFMDVIGITGTNGKTTITYLLESILACAGCEPGVIGTVDVRYAGKTERNEHTTPQATQFQRLLYKMKESGISHVISEVSSHALALQRARSCHFKVGVFTNISRDHLDYHGDFESYAASKELLFSRELVQSHAKGKVAVINADDPLAARMVQSWPGRVLRFGKAKRADISPLSETTFSLDGLRVEVATPNGTIQVQSKLIGEFNLENILAAMAVGIALKIRPQVISLGLSLCERVPGRLERLDLFVGQPYVFVDYAHTDHALDNVLSAVRPLVAGRLIVVFGAGGDRDQGKRPLMGAAVLRHADLAVVTSDNPRGEDPQEIIDQILMGMVTDGSKPVAANDPAGQARGYVVVVDRAAAIEMAVQMAHPKDMILIAGKGHEDYQIIGSRRLDFDDRVVATRALTQKYGEGGP
jgi:UDP-N-acetylmuramoyl-L-alanyl-D-glutamate--2,6-diaminopimelate ligase